MSRNMWFFLLTSFLLSLLLASCHSVMIDADSPPSRTEEIDPADGAEIPSSPETISTVHPPADLFTVSGLAPGQTLAMYQSHSPGSPIIAQIPSTGSSLSPTSGILIVAGSNWIQVDFKGQSGWVDYSYLAQQYGNLPEDLIQLGQEVLSALSSFDYQQLAGLVHPDLCLSFSPYLYLDPDRQIFCEPELTNIADSDAELLWGHYDGSGEPIFLSFREYHQRFIYDQDYFHSPIVGFNTEVSSGNSINNIQELYPDGMMIEYYFPGFDPQYGGMDWRSIRLVFVQMGSRWFLTAVIHGEWTI